MNKTTNNEVKHQVGSRFRKRAVILFGAAAVAAIAISCASTVNRIIMAPPHIAGATFVGSQTCADCHEDVVKGFRNATHAGLKNHHGENVSCESCHGPGSVHVESGGAYHTIVNPGRSPEACFGCHLDKRGEFHLPHSHPVLAGHMSCTDCHDPHKGDAVMGRGTALASQNDSCLKCHTEQRGPHTFEHEALREGCTTCHAPHGSVNNKMLVARNSNLCLKCHFQEHRGGQIVIGTQDHTTFLRTGTCWSAGCHEAVHGSYVHPSLRF